MMAQSPYVVWAPVLLEYPQPPSVPLPAPQPASRLVPL